MEDDLPDLRQQEAKDDPMTGSQASEEAAGDDITEHSQEPCPPGFECILCESSVEDRGNVCAYVFSGLLIALYPMLLSLFCRAGLASNSPMRSANSDGSLKKPSSGYPVIRFRCSSVS